MRQNLKFQDNSSPVKTINGQTPDESGNVTVETGSTVDESRLLPENPGDGDVPVFNATATTGGGNDESTKFLLQPIAGDETIVDTAAGNPAPVAITNNGVSVAADGGMLFTGSAPCGLIIPAYTLPAGVFDGSTDFVIDISYTADSTATGRQCIFGQGEPPGRFDFLLDTDGYLSIGSGPSLGSGWPFDVQVLLTVEIYKEDNAWKYTCFRDGAVVASGNWNNDPVWREVDQPIGFDGSSRYFKGTIHAFRITTGTTHRGQAFTPDPLPWTVPQVVGEWKSIAVDDLTSLMDANKLVPAITEQDVGKVLSVAGSQVQEGNDENTFLLLHFDGNTTDSSDNARSDITSNGISFPNGKFNKAAQFSGSTSSYVAIPSTSEFPFSGDFTISFWVNASDSSRRGLIAYQNDHRLCIDTINGVYSIWASSNGSNWDILQADSEYNAELTSDSGRGSIAITPGVWQHIAYVHSGEDWYLFVDGVMSTHKQRSGQVYNAGEELRIGRYGNDNIDPFAGWIDEFKIDTIARWTSNFTPPEHAYDSFISEGIHTEFTDIGDKIDKKITAHNQSPSAHPGVVRSVNGVHPDASGNVTIGTGGGGLTSVATGAGLTGDGTGATPLTLDLSNYEAPGSVQINSSAALNSAIKLSSGFTEHSGGSGGASEMAQSWYNELTMDADGLLLMTDVGATIKVPSISKLKLEQGRHSGAANKAYGFAIVGSNGKLPSSILPAVVSHAYGLPIVEVGGNICHLLDATYTELNLADFARNVSAIEFYIRSASDTITGNIVIIPCVGSTELNPITLSVTTTDVKKTIEFNPPVTGMISFKRDISSESDTLKDVDVVSAIIGSDLMIMVNS